MLRLKQCRRHFQYHSHCLRHFGGARALADTIILPSSMHSGRGVGGTDASESTELRSPKLAPQPTLTGLPTKMRSAIAAIERDGWAAAKSRRSQGWFGGVLGGI